MTASDAVRVSNDFIQMQNKELFWKINAACKEGKRDILVQTLSRELVLCLKDLGYCVSDRTDYTQKDLELRVKISW